MSATEISYPAAVPASEEAPGACGIFRTDPVLRV